MPVDAFVTGAIESIINRLIKDDADYVRQLQRLKGKVIQFQVRELNKTFTFVFSHQVDVLAAYEGQADCFLSLSLATLPQLKDSSNITQLIKQDKLVLEGDIQLAQKFSQLMTDVKPDIEEWLSRVTGDVIAHTAVRQMKAFDAMIRRQYQRQSRMFAEAVTEEWRLAVGPLESAHFCDEVDQLAADTDKLIARLDALSGRL